VALTLYSLLLWSVALPVLLARLGLRALRNPAYRSRLSERFSLGASLVEPCDIWVHAVSVGEVKAATPLVNELLKLRPHLRILVTTMTPTGTEQVAASFGDRVRHCYAPYDYPFAVKRFLEQARPRLLVLMETEIWPNIINHCHARGIKVAMTNVRLSEKSARGYRAVGFLVRDILAKVSVFAVQSNSDQERLVTLGANAARVHRTGSMKFEVQLPASLREVAQVVRRDWGRNRPVVVAGSTHQGEETMLLKALMHLRENFPDILLVIAPRHPERFGATVHEARKAGFRVNRRSQQPGPLHNDVLVQVADAMGELPILYAAADVAVVGGSLIRIRGIGGHNLLEPCAVGVPVLFGPYMSNFQQISRMAQVRQAGLEVRGEAELTAQLVRLLNDPSLRTTIGENGLAMVSENTGATRRALDLLLPLLSQAVMNEAGKV